MGKQCSKIKCHSCQRKTITLLMLGLDNAGKTTTARHFLGQSIEDMVPTIGFSTLKFKHKMYDIEIYDLGGNKNIRGIWSKYYALVHGIIFVIDSTDKERLDECKEILHTVVDDPRVSKKPILLLVNKQDKEEALNEVELCGVIEIESLVNRYECPTRVETTVASIQIKKQKDKGIQKGFYWLIHHIIKNFGVLSTRVQGESEDQRQAEEKERLERVERVRKSREEREKEENVVLPNRIEHPLEVKEEQNGNPFRPISELSAVSLVKDSSETKLPVGGPRNEEQSDDTSFRDLNNDISRESEKDGPKQKKKLFKNKISPDSTNQNPTTTLELPPIRKPATMQDGQSNRTPEPAHIW